MIDTSNSALPDVVFAFSGVVQIIVGGLAAIGLIIAHQKDIVEWVLNKPLNFK